MSDLIERLRHFSGDPAYGILSNARAAMVEATDRIEALEAALQPIATLLQEAVTQREAWGIERVPANHESADEIYAWALNLNWGDVRRIIAALPHP